MKEINKVIEIAEDGSKKIVLNATQMSNSDKKIYGVAKIEQLDIFAVTLKANKAAQTVETEVTINPLSATILGAIGIQGVDTSILESEINMLYGQENLLAQVRKRKHLALGKYPSLVAFDARECQGFDDPKKGLKAIQRIGQTALRDGFWFNGEIKEAWLSKPDVEAKHYEVFITTPSKTKKAGGFACPSDFKEDNVEKYHPDVAKIAATLTGRAAMLNYLTNGFIAEQMLKDKTCKKPTLFVLNKLMARFGLMMSGGQSFDITGMNFSYQKIGDIILELDKITEQIDIALDKRYGPEPSERKFRAKVIWIKNYKKKKGDGQFYIKASAMAKFLQTHMKENNTIENIATSIIGKAYIMRIVMHVKNAEGHTGCVEVKGLGIVLPDECFNNVPNYNGTDILLTEDTVKLHTLPDGEIQRVWLQICRESSHNNSNNTNSQALAMLEGDMSKMNSIEAVLKARNVFIGKATSVIDCCFDGFHNTDSAIAALRLFQKNNQFLRKAPLETFAMKLMVLDGDASKSPLARKAYSLAIVDIIKGMQNGKMPIDASFELMINDPSIAFPPAKRFIDTGEVVFGKPVYRLELELEDMTLVGSNEVYRARVSGDKIMARNPLQAPGQICKGEFIPQEELSERLSKHKCKDAWLKFYKKFQGVIISGTGIIEGILGGADFDGDIVLCFWDDDFNELVTATRLPCIAQDADLPPIKEVLTMDNVKEFIALSIKANAVGILSNWAAAIRDIALNIFGGFALPGEVVSALLLMSTKAKQELKINPNSPFIDAIKAMAEMDINNRATIIAALEKASQPIATLVMQEVDSTKSGVSVNPNDYGWLKPAYKAGSKEVLVVPNHFKYATGVRRKIVTESTAKFIYESQSPLGELTRVVFEAEAKVRKLVKTSYKGEALFGDANPVIWNLFLDKAMEYSEDAASIMEKYDCEDSTTSRTKELSELASEHRQYWEAQVLNNNWQWKQLAAVMDHYCLQLPDDADKFLNIYPTEVLGDRYFQCIHHLVKGQRKELIPIKFYEIGYAPIGTYQVISDVVYKDEIAVGKVKNGVPNGDYKIQKIGNVCYLSKATAPDSKWIGTTFRIFGNKTTAVDAAVLKSAIIANNGLVDIKRDFENATVTIGSVCGKLSEKDGIVGGHTFKVEIIGETVSSLTLKVLSEI